MKPFDLQAALVGAKVITRDGRDVKIAGYNEDAHKSCRLADWLNSNTCTYWAHDGRWHTIQSEHDNDLFMAPTERKEWIVRHYAFFPMKDVEDYVNFAGPFKSLPDAERYAKYADKATIHEITIIE